MVVSPSKCDKPDLSIFLVQHGPFVMNTREEISQAIEDYQMGKNGFEMAHRWKSVEGNR